MANGQNENQSKAAIRGPLMVAGIVLIFLLSFSFAPLVPFWGSFAVFFVLTGIFIWQALRRIPADPPHVGILLFLGERKPEIIKEGLRFFPICGPLTDSILINITKVNQDLPEQCVRTPDRAEIAVSVSITWQPAYSSFELLRNFIDSGQRDGVGNILKDIVSDRLRSWAFSDTEGPSTWQEAMGSGYEATGVLLEAVIGEELPPVPRFPVIPLLKSFSGVTPSEYEKEKWGENWSELKEQLEAIPPEERNKIEEALELRQKQIKNMRGGNGKVPKKELGIVINRLTVNSVDLRGHTAEAADMRATEVQQREAEKEELDHIRERLHELKAAEISADEAMRVIQVERGKVAQNVQVHQVDLSPPLRELISQIFKGG